ncbi:MAG: hypothetical protein ACKODH_03540, partial [Limisphaerales bacterium]
MNSRLELVALIVPRLRTLVASICGLLPSDKLKNNGTVAARPEPAAPTSGPRIKAKSPARRASRRTRILSVTSQGILMDRKVVAR